MAEQVYRTEDRGGGKPSKTPKVRRESGWRLLEEHFEEIEVKSGGRVVVPSESIAGLTYRVDPSRQFCSCPDNEIGGNVCKHVNAASWAAMIASSGYRIERRFNSRVGLDEWHEYDDRTGKWEGFRYSLMQAIADVVEMAAFKGWLR